MADMNIQRSAKVMASDGEIGKVTHVIVDPRTKEVTELVVEGKNGQSTVPMSAVSKVEGDRVMLNGAGAQFSSRRFDREQYHPVDEGTVRAESEHTASRGGAPLLDAKKNEVEVGGRQQAAPEPRREPMQPARAEQEGGYRLQLRQEHLTASKERQQAGTVEVGKRVVEHQESVEVPLTEERVVIERTAATGGKTGGTIGDSKKWFHNSSSRRLRQMIEQARVRKATWISARRS